MNIRFRNMIITSIRRRKKEISRVSIIAFLAAFFVMATLLFQNNVDSYQQQENKLNYGEWFLSETTDGNDSAQALSDNVYFDQCGIVQNGPSIGGNTKYLMGTVDDTTIDMGHIRLREGHMPVNDNEVVMQLNLMASLGIGSDLGQNIQLSYTDKNGKTQTKDFILCGILVDYTDNWVNGSSMPAALVSSKCFEAINILTSKNYLYHLRSTVELKGDGKFVEDLSKSVKEPLVYNSYAFEKGIWSDTTAYREIIIILICISVCALAYTYLSYIAKRKTEYYRLRCFGINKLQLKKLVIYEGLYACIPSAAAGFAAALILSLFLVYLLTFIYHAGFFFSIKATTIFISIVSIVVTILLSISLVTLLVTDRHIYRNTLKISPNKIKRIKPKHLNHKNFMRKFHTREWKLHRLRIMLSILLSIGITLFTLLCIHKVRDYYMFSYGRYITRPDFKVNVPSGSVTVRYNEDLPGTKYSTSKEVIAYTDAFSRDFYDSLNAIDGIQSANYFTLDSSKVITWNGIENSPVRAKQLSTFKNVKTVSDENFYTYASAFYSDAKGIYESYREDIAPEYYDPDAFARGEQVIYVSASASMYTDGDMVYENTLSIGDRITYHTETGDIQATVVAMVYLKDSSAFLHVNSKYEYDFIGSQTLGEKIAEADHAQFGYNQLNFKLNPNVSFDGTNKRLTNLFSNYKLKFRNYYEEKAQRRNAFLQKLFVFGMMITIVLSIYIVIYANMIATGMKYKKYNMKLLKNLGVTNKKLAWMEIRKCIGENLLILIALPILYIITWYNIYKTNSENLGLYGMYNKYTGNYITDKYEATIYTMQHHATPLFCAISLCVTALIFFILLLVAIVPIVNYIKHLNKEN